MKNIICKILNYLSRFSKVRENRIVFECGRGNVDESPKAIYDYIKGNCSDEFETRWIVEKGVDTSGLKNGEWFYYHSLKGLYYQATSKYWIRSQSLFSPLDKKKNQVYIQTWHGIGALKKGGYQITGKVPKVPLEHCMEWDYLLATDAILLKNLLEATGYRGKCDIVGVPITDYFHDVTEDEKEKIRIKYNVNNNKKIVLYAPTFREWYVENEKCDLDINKIGEMDNINFIVTCHPLMRKAMKNYQLNKNIIDAIDCSNLSELLCIADVMISDYSGSIISYMYFKKPIIYYAYDYNKYKSAKNGFCLNYKKDLPGPFAKNVDEVIKYIKNIDTIEAIQQNKYESLKNKYHDMNDGKVCERIVDNLRNKKYEPYR